MEESKQVTLTPDKVKGYWHCQDVNGATRGCATCCRLLCHLMLWHNAMSWHHVTPWCHFRGWWQGLHNVAATTTPVPSPAASWSAGGFFWAMVCLEVCSGLVETSRQLLLSGTLLQVGPCLTCHTLEMPLQDVTRRMTWDYRERTFSVSRGWKLSLSG